MKSVAFFLCRSLGLFRLAWWLTADRPRILCYHGISLDDEHKFRPGLFMAPTTFADRMALIRKWGMKPSTLDDLQAAHEQGVYPPHLLVITIDDGWAGMAEGMMPALSRHEFPATLYLSSYFVEARRPVFKVAASYLFWKYQKAFTPDECSCVRAYTDATTLNESELLTLAKSMGSQYEQPLLEELGEYFGESIVDWRASGKFYFLSPQQVGRLAAEGLTIELHTHRHRFSELELDGARREVEDNRQAIRDIAGVDPTHFCFPRGEYSPGQLTIMQDMGIRTATTTRNELVLPTDSILELPRLMDSEGITSLEFEAELSGFMSLARQLLARRSLK